MDKTVFSAEKYFLLLLTLLLQFDFSKLQMRNVQDGNVAINKPEVNSEVHCQCTCNPVNNKNSVLFANGQLTLELQEQLANNQQQTTLERPPKLKQKTEPINVTPSRNSSSSNGIPNATTNNIPTNSTNEETKNNETEKVLADNFVRELPPSILSNPTDIEKMSVIDGFRYYYQKQALGGNMLTKQEMQMKNNAKRIRQDIDAPSVTFVGKETNRKLSKTTRNQNSGNRAPAISPVLQEIMEPTLTPINNDITETPTEAPVRDLVIGRPFQDTEILVTRKIDSESVQEVPYLIDGQPFESNQNNGKRSSLKQKNNKNNRKSRNDSRWSQNKRQGTNDPYNAPGDWQTRSVPDPTTTNPTWDAGGRGQQWSNNKNYAYEGSTRGWRRPGSTTRPWSNSATGIPIARGNNWRGGNPGRNFNQRPTVGPSRGPPPRGPSQTRPPLGPSQVSHLRGPPQRPPSLGPPQGRPPLGSPPRPTHIGPPQGRPPLGVPQRPPHLGPPQRPPSLVPLQRPPQRRPPQGIPPFGPPQGPSQPGRPVWRQ